MPEDVPEEISLPYGFIGFVLVGLAVFGWWLMIRVGWFFLGWVFSVASRVAGF